MVRIEDAGLHALALVEVGLEPVRDGAVPANNPHHPVPPALIGADPGQEQAGGRPDLLSDRDQRGSLTLRSTAETEPDAVGRPGASGSLEAQLHHLEVASVIDLRAEWRRLFGSDPPRLSRDLLVRALAYGIHERGSEACPARA